MFVNSDLKSLKTPVALPIRELNFYNVLVTNVRLAAFSDETNLVAYSIYGAPFFTD